MDPAQFFASSTVLIVAGKGGVGKTVSAATFATAASRLGKSVHLVEIGGRSAMADLFGVNEITYEGTVIRAATATTGEIQARSVTPDDALSEWLSDHGFRRIAKRMAKTGLLEVVATATPGIKDLLVLGKVKQLELAKVADLIVVDAPAAGQALSFLRAPGAILDTARAGAIHRQAEEGLKFLGDPTRSRVVMVTLPEETPVNELIETAFAIEDDVGVTLAPAVINSVLPPLDDLPLAVGRTKLAAGLDPDQISDLQIASDLRRRRQEMHIQQCSRLKEQLPLDQITLPQMFVPTMGPADIQVLATAMLEAIAALPEPAPVPRQ